MDVVVTDLEGRAIAFVDSYSTLTITPRLNGAAELTVELDPLDPAVARLTVGSTALKVYEDGTLRFHGKLWELARSSTRVAVAARDPYAELAQRRVRDQKTYPSQDAGLIAFDRLSIQNGYRNTYLRAGTRQASADRARTYTPGHLEGEIITGLADADSGFFFQAAPIDGVAGVMADLNIRYPDAGTTREEVRFEYGENTRDNLADYEVLDTLPRNRITVASAAAAGGRIAKAAADTSSSDTYGLFEEETVFADVTADTVLAEHAKAELRPAPPRTFSCTPNTNAPALYRDFNVGDFVRIRINHGSLEVFSWVRVADATVTVDQDGVARLTALTLETVVGGKPAELPQTVFRRYRDEQRRRLEALERRVENISAAQAAAPAAPVPDSGSSDPTPAEPAPAAPVAAPAPTPPPTLSGFTATGVNYLDNGVLRRGVEFAVDVDPHGLAANARFEITGVGASSDLAVPAGGGRVSYFFATAAGTYSTDAAARSTAGDSYYEPRATSVTVPAVTAA